jgi:hypothetical protein
MLHSALVGIDNGSGGVGSIPLSSGGKTEAIHLHEKDACNHFLILFFRLL